VGRFSRREALSYLSSRLTEYTDQRVEALDLAEDLEGLPLGLAQAAAVMNANRMSCQEYRAQFGERRAYMSGRPVEGVTPAVLATWSLAAECAHQLVPAGLAWPALALAAMLDPHGIPGAVLTSPAACGFIAGRPSSATSADQNLARTAITNLAVAGLVSIDPANAIRTVRMHRCVQAAVRAYLPPADSDQVQVAAADALVQTWPDPGNGRDGELELDGCGVFRPPNRREDHVHVRVTVALRDDVPEVIEQLDGDRVVAVGTTALRTLESAAASEGEVAAGCGWTDIYIYPPYAFKIVDALLTNFHLPRSTLLMLVSAFAGRKRILDAYAEAVRRSYRFYSFGDAMFIERTEMGE